VTALGYLPYSPDLPPPDFFLFPPRKSVLKGQRFSSADVTAKATSTDRGIEKWFPGLLPKKLYELWENWFTAQGNYFE
jgi:hypothetical protein